MKRVRKSSKADTQVLTQPFPSSSTKRRLFSGAFDPTKECVATSQQKKKAFRSKVQVLFVDELDCSIPCGKYRKELAASDKKLEFVQNMLSLGVKSTMLEGFKHLPGFTNFTLLEADQSGKLNVSNTQEPDGQYIIESA